ncbi:hypothetical protein ACIPEL_15245 [Streptomyces griseoviridis]
MTTPHRPVPAPPRRAAPLPAPPAAAARPPAPSGPAGYDRHRWESALLATRLPHRNAVLLGFALAHLAGDAGYVPAGATGLRRLARYACLTERETRMSLTQLERRQLVERPAADTWEPQDIPRPITLTIGGRARQKNRPATPDKQGSET